MTFLADCPTRTGLDLVSGTWTLVVMHALRDTAKRPRALREEIGGISAKSLNETLRRRERNRLVRHVKIAEAPPRVDYHLTELGRGLLLALDPLAAWVAEHESELPT
ncbi:winged helix-turn-helix transcriptional regulator [Amycolatopsis sp. CA-230715]|uniref:winged helix-turn-helix transcriptional regulator n=1 Tax=Amycolatopsis sp. CA-230715 TaxID=2745196 RepID=UPI001C035DB0|nr:helix-turn-helix domain-containing protein [Amycolatopsis sp. CA-230715]QWF79505.1 putative HTH-type transcriptional regulator YtcD [Amycolatopsis sp. CA-230715]